MKQLNQPPFQQPISDANSIVDKIWYGFFLQLWKLFSQPSYGPKTPTFIFTGLSGTHTDTYQYVSDRNFVWFSIIVDPDTSMTASDATISGLEDLPLIDSNVDVSLIDKTTGATLDQRVVCLTTDGIIHIPDTIACPYKMVISGKYLKDF